MRLKPVFHEESDVLHCAKVTHANKVRRIGLFRYIKIQTCLQAGLSLLRRVEGR